MNKSMINNKPKKSFGVYIVFNDVEKFVEKFREDNKDSDEIIDICIQINGVEQYTSINKMKDLLLDNAHKKEYFDGAKLL